MVPGLTGLRLFAVRSEVHGIRVESARFTDDAPVNAALRIVARCLAGSYGSANYDAEMASVVLAHVYFDEVYLHHCYPFAGRVLDAAETETD
jgi:hypothetical protein